MFITRRKNRIDRMKEKDLIFRDSKIKTAQIFAICLIFYIL